MTRAALAILVGSALLTQAQTGRVLTGTMPTKTANRQAQPLVDGARHGVRLDARPDDGIAWWPDAACGNCTIDVDLRGKDVLQQSFLGIAFHGVDANTFDDVYFRPFNFKAPDADRRAHAVQYESHPGFTWDKLRADHPGQYEHGLGTPPDPNGWFHARIVLAYPS